ncbi:glutathione peroxidase [Dysgonomonas sp. 520]|uniref:glutathione peroxidase n=1 Tax=Dysgonomonas sp. 520 TaxID=2302931 RepID=UPI0013D708D8|nr:glutathione peroxidase [Dysgonomonas sp. 520]NDW09217.1 glutathione peroxidase [Dysgonomonas sp. 520]
MKSFYIILFVLFFSISAIMAQGKDIYSYKVKNIDGEEFDMSSLKGKKVLIVNVASKCGFTPQYEQLEKLYQMYKDENFVVIGFPSNDFKGQEPGTNAEIKDFCQRNYGVTFPIMSKISVTGKNIAPIYKWLTEKKENGKLDSKVLWNFQKYMIDESGSLVDMAPSKESPLSDKIINWIEK